MQRPLGKGTYDPTGKSTYSLLRGLRGFVSTVLIGATVISAHEPPRMLHFMFSLAHSISAAS